MRPIIGVTGNFDEGGETFLLKRYYIDSVYRAGGTALILPPTADEAIIDDYISICRGIVFSGGGDINPSYWGGMPEKGLGEINPLRDLFEIALAKKVMSLEIPALGICRGCQVLNVAAGGSIVQDINSCLNHDQSAPRSALFHAIFIEQGTCLASIIGSKTILVNSFHHQAVGDLGINLKLAACAADGTIEAVEADDHPFFIGVQWHPECLQDTTSLRLFKALVNRSDNK